MFAHNSSYTKLFFLAAGGALLAGCNVDRIWEPQQVRGPEMDEPAARLPQPPGGRDIAIVQPGEVDLVEDLLSKRQAYHAALIGLRDYYTEHGYAAKESWARSELQNARRVRAFRYLVDAEIPSSDLVARSTIPEADELYAKGLDTMRRGGHGVPGVYSRRVMLNAADLFRELIERFPASDKIDDAAFALGEIHKEYLEDQETLAVKWYERAWTWDPNTPHPARFQAASVSDFRLHDRDRALELYQRVLEDEPDISRSNTRFATRRIEQLTSERQRRTVRVETKSD